MAGERKHGRPPDGGRPIPLLNSMTWPSWRRATHSTAQFYKPGPPGGGSSTYLRTFVVTPILCLKYLRRVVRKVRTDAGRGSQDLEQAA